jgi:hypothetical protein
MTQFIIAYHGGSKPETQEQGAEQMARWQTWLGELGDAVVNPGTPLGKSHTVTQEGVSDGSGPDVLTGFSIVEAETLEAALEMAKACPFLEMGTLEVAEVMKM